MTAEPSNRDLLFGCRAIAQFVRDDLDLPLSDRQVGYMIEVGRIPAGFVGRRRIGSREAIRETLVKAARGDRGGAG
jgi:hypothetical protein